MDTLHAVIVVATVVGICCMAIVVRSILSGIRAGVALALFPFRCVYACGAWAGGCRNEPPAISRLLNAEQEPEP